MAELRLHDMRMHTSALGPGVRAAIWFQGCNKRCPGCMSPKSRDPEGGHLVSTDNVINAVLNTHDIEGITISGGEPFLQIDALHEIIVKIKRNTDLGVIIYTGLTIDDLRKMNNPKVDEIINGLADLIIDGEYVDELNDGKSLRGSSNQNINYITDRYKEYADLYGNDTRKAEVFIEGDEAFFVGIPDKESLEGWKNIGKQ